MEKLMIFGDSYSTYEGYIPAGYAPYYTGHRDALPDLDSVEKTWWKLLATEKNYEIVMNNSWSGSTICYTGYNNFDASTSNSFIYRFEKLLENGFFKENHIDKLLVFGATNDNWCGAPEGEVKFGNITHEERYSVLPGISHFMQRLVEELKDTEIYFILNTEFRPTMNEGIRAICEHYGVPLIVLENIDKVNGHPTELGMVQIKDQVAAALN